MRLRVLGRNMRKGVAAVGEIEVTSQDLPSGGRAVIFRLNVRSVIGPGETADLKGRIVQVLEYEDSDLVVVDLRDLQHANTQLFAILLVIQRRLTDTGRTLRLCHVDPDVEEAIRLCMLQRVFTLYPTLDDALR